MLYIGHLSLVASLWVIGKDIGKCELHNRFTNFSQSKEDKISLYATFLLANPGSVHTGTSSFVSSAFSFTFLFISGSILFRTCLQPAFSLPHLLESRRKGRLGFGQVSLAPRRDFLAMPNPVFNSTFEIVNKNNISRALDKYYEHLSAVGSC